MNEYTASNGATVRAGEVGDLSIEKTGSWALLDPPEAMALREFFQAEADERLGRWRDPEQPDFIVYGPFEPDEIGYDLIVLNEQTGERAPYRQSDDEHGGKDFAHPWSNKHAWAARHWFTAHPEPKPDWQSAEPGEHWSLTVEAEERAYVAVLTNRGRDGSNVVTFYPIRDPISPALGRLAEVITAGTRIYPPADPS